MHPIRLFQAVLTIAAVAPALAASPFAPTPSRSTSRAEIQRAIDAVYPSLVRIHVVSENGEEGRMQKSRSSGSGCIISKDGYILTNHHVAGRATRLVCRLSNREEVEAELVGTDPLTDLSVLKLNLATRRNPGEPLSCALFGDSDKLKVGDVVLAMGSPAGLSQSVTRGIVANTEMISPGGAGSFKLDGESVGELVRWIGHDAVIFPGNSGGPLVNLSGQVIGVNEVGIGSLGGAIPGNLAKKIAQEIITRGYVRRSWVGLVVQPLLKDMSSASGVLVSTVLPNSPAEKAEIKPGDFITEYDGQTVVDARAPEDLPLFNRLMTATPVGAQIKARGMRDGKPMQWTLTTVERQPNEARETELLNWGLTVRDFTLVSALEKHRPSNKGVLVDTVRSGGPSASSKPPLQLTDVITAVDGVEMADSKALDEWTRKFVKGLSEPKPVLVTFERDMAQMITVVKIGPEVEQDKPQRPAKGWLGASTQVLTQDIADALGVKGSKGVRVIMVSPDSPAEKAGIKAGDLFFKIDGDVIAASTPSDAELFGNLIRQMKVGSEVELDGQRAGAPLKIKVTLGETPKPTADLAEFKDELFEFSARDMSQDDRTTDRMKRNQAGVKISAVKDSGWAALAGLRTGDVLMSVGGQNVESIARLKAVMREVSELKPVRVRAFVKRGIYSMFVELEPKW